MHCFCVMHPDFYLLHTAFFVQSGKKRGKDTGDFRVLCEIVTNLSIWFRLVIFRPIALIYMTDTPADVGESLKEKKGVDHFGMAEPFKGRMYPAVKDRPKTGPYSPTGKGTTATAWEKPVGRGPSPWIVIEVLSTV